MLLSENEWPIGPDGLPTRDAARVIVFDEEKRVLLIQGHDFSDASRRWWFTVGGGVEAGESPREAAIRECLEETGIQLQPDDLVGPAAYRDAKFHFADRTRRQKEHFFLAQTQTKPVTNQGWTPDEQNVLDDMRWLSLEEVAVIRTQDQIYPPALPALIEDWLINGWDGKCIRLEE